jgi:hypothetical protein
MGISSSKLSSNQCFWCNGHFSQYSGDDSKRRATPQKKRCRKKTKAEADKFNECAISTKIN